MKTRKAAVIIADTGFSADSLAGAKRILGVYDLVQRRVILGNPYVTDATDLGAFAGDPHKHGSFVLKAVLAQDPDVPLVLIRSHDPEEGVIRTSWQDGKPAADGWTEAYLWAVRLCQLHGLASVANFSFGRVFHAADGTGWDAFQFARVVGEGKPGHVIVAAAGPGDGRAVHAAFTADAQAPAEVAVQQDSTTSYNFWTKVASVSDEDVQEDWVLEVWRDGRVVMRQDGAFVPVNFWNGRKQLQFSLEGTGNVTLVVRLKEGASGERGFECWLQAGDARFLNHVDDTYIVEPAAFPSVIAVGLKAGKYSPKQKLPGHKPDVLVDGGGPISFRLPEVVIKVARILEDNGDLDALQVLALLGKYPVLA
ncbi:MAG: hypothetical protein IT342_24050 [Candidatus Melainabacteria bacterium]|nr:hypothetical protein [Candidatus Melainabacteria bacterium]